MEYSDEESTHLRKYWQIILKRRMVVLIFFFLVVGIVALFSFMIDPTYRSTARLMLEEDIPAVTFITNSRFFERKNPDQLFETHQEILGTRIFADKVARKLQLDRHPHILEMKEKLKKKENSFFVLTMNWLNQKINKTFSKSAKLADISPRPAYAKELDPDITDMILENTNVSHKRRSDIFNISFISNDPKFAAFMANGIPRIYIEHNLNIRVKPFGDAVDWLSAKMLELRNNLEESEKGLQKYKEAKGIVSFEANENIITQKLRELISGMVRSEGERQEAQARYNQIKSVIDKPDLLATVPDIMNNRVIQTLIINKLEAEKSIAELSKKFGYKHPAMITAVSNLKVLKENLITETHKMLNAAKTELEIAGSREASLRRAIEKQKREVLDLSKKAIEFNVVSDEAQTNKRFYTLLLNKLQETSLSSGISVTNVQIIDPAVVPDEPIKPNKRLNILLASIVGLFGGIGMAFFVNYMDDTIKSQDDVEKILGIPFLGIAPSTNEDDADSPYIPDSKSVAAEAYRTISTAIRFSSLDDPPKIILVTSSIPDEGKTKTGANLAVSMALQMKRKVLLIDSDLRRPSLHNKLGLNNEVGFSNIIEGSHSNLSSALKTIPGVPYLRVITGGAPVPNPLELLNSNRMKIILEAFRKRYDRIVLDSPPVEVFSDSLILSSFADGVVFVVWGGITGRDVIKKSIQSLKSANTKILGIVLNNLSMTKKTHYDYYRYYNSYVKKKA